MPIFHLLRETDCFTDLWAVPRPDLKELWVEARDESSLDLLRRLPLDGLAIVGTRQPQSRSEYFTERLVRSLQGTRAVILSGLALGIDQVAHESALDAQLPTIAVLGCGHQHQYPLASEKLRDAIVRAGGLIVSEFAPWTPPSKHFFVKRNRLIAGWSQATCVIEAPAKSGALITADYAMERHATVFCVPSFPGDLSFAGNQRLIDEHAAIPLWGAHSLGVVWLEFSALQRPIGFDLSMPPRATPLKNPQASS